MTVIVIRFYRIIIAVCLGLILSVFLYFHFTAESAPRLANYYLRWEIRPGDVVELAKWDLLILDMETQVNSRGALEKIRQLNPNIKILAYVTAQEMRNDAFSGYSVMRRKLASGVPSEWYLSDVGRQRYSFWPGTQMLNPTNLCPAVNGKKWNQYLADFMTREVLSTGLWDGIFYDNTWDSLMWFTGNNVDINQDGVADTQADVAWRAGMRELFNETRKLAGDKYILIGNAVTRYYGEDWNGNMVENFAQHAWTEIMNVYKLQSQAGRQPRVIVINANMANKEGNNYQAMRYGLASTLLGNGYFSFDYGDKDHGQVWWYDEYNVNLGEATGESQSVTGGAKYVDGVWRRDYAHGLAIVNSTGVEQTVDLGADYEKIIGKQDPLINNGEVVDKIKLSAKDGLILLKTSQKIDNLVFDNGSLARFLDMRGVRARNGFFISDENYPAEAQVFNGELNNEIGLEKISIDQGGMKILNSRGDVWYDGSPFGVEYKGGLRMAVGKFSGDVEKSLVVANTQGGVNLYNYYGGVIKEYFYPWGKKTGRSFSVALGNVDVDGNVVLGGGGSGRSGVVMIYDRNLNKLRRTFFPYGTAYRGGVEVVVGDVNGDGLGEIVTAQSGLSSVMVRVWNAKAKKISEFKVSSTFGGTKIRLGTADVNFDGKDEIVVMSK